MRNLKYLQKLFFLLVMGFSLNIVCASNNMITEINNQRTIGDKPKPNSDTIVINGYEAVDLGLSVKWATCNIGANAPEEAGSYYAWGETEEKENYEWNNYKWSYEGSDHMTKYSKSRYGKKGKADKKTVLDPEDDVAHVKWGSSWRMPTFDEIQELLSNCTWQWVNQNGVNGQLVTASNGNSIFLPVTGIAEQTLLHNRNFYGCYWSAALSEDSSDAAYIIFFDRSYSLWTEHKYRKYGCPIRPVTD